jgi:uncharacterized protein YbcI
MTQPSADRVAHGARAAAISNAVVRLLSEHTGHGPTKARTYVNDELITVVLRDTLTKGERTLAGRGETELVLANRTAYQNTLGAALTAAVEEISGRRVRAFLSANHIDPDYAVESFILDPIEDAAPPRGAPEA